MMETLFEEAGLSRWKLPPELLALYGGPLGFAAPRVAANFVASVDGVVSLRADTESGAIISGGNDADHFLMGLLRACAEVVLIGAGTFRAGAGDRWTPEAIWPAGAAAFAELRRSLALPPQPRLVVLTDSGDVDLSALQDPAALVTTARGEARLRGRLPAHVQLLVAREERASPETGGARSAEQTAQERVTPAELLRLIGAKGLLLTEGGPTLVAELAAAGLLDELFVTISPKLFGRFAGDGRKSLLSGADLHGAPLDLKSLRKSGSHLFLRYARAGRGQ